MPDSVIRKEELSTLTSINRVNAKKFMEDNKRQTALLVSDPLHMKRSILLAKSYPIDVKTSPT